AELLVDRHLGIDAVQLVQIDAIDRERLQAAEHGGAQRLGTAVGGPLERAGPQEATLRRDDDAPIRMQHLADEHLADQRAVRVRGAGERAAEPGREPQRLARSGEIRRWAEHAAADDAHRAEADPVDVEVADLHVASKRAVASELSALITARSLP